MKNNRQKTFVDLFAGCGGFSEGFYAEGFRALLHVDFDRYACDTLEERMEYYKYTKEEIDSAILCGDITSKEIMFQIKQRLRNKTVDVVAGGPPCQSFSSLGKAKDPYSMAYDKRNYLFQNYIDILDICNPRVFVFENVTGILSSKVDGKLIINVIFNKMKRKFKICSDLKTIVLNAVNYGVPQLRERVILVGVRKDIGMCAEHVYSLIEKTHYAPDDAPKDGLEKFISVEEAIGDLPRIKHGEGSEQVKFKPQILNRFTSVIRYDDPDYLCNHVARTHNAQDIERYRLMSKNRWTLTQLYKTSPHLMHIKKRLFDNSYVVQRADLPGRTIIAHLYKDGNQFIHPDSAQARTFTVREAARIQSFPDNFKFMGSRTQQYKQVGNAVPPLLAKAIAKGIKKALREIDGCKE